MTTEIINCQFCGRDHGKRCPEVKAIEYDERGGVRRVEFITPSDYLAPITHHIPVPLLFHPDLGQNITLRGQNAGEANLG